MRNLIAAVVVALATACGLPADPYHWECESDGAGSGTYACDRVSNDSSNPDAPLVDPETLPTVLRDCISACLATMNGATEPVCIRWCMRP